MSKYRRYHINPVIGVPTICRAEFGKCPYEGESGHENHFDTYSEAQMRALEIFEETSSLLPSSLAEDKNEIMREIEARKIVKEDIFNKLPKEDDFKITKTLMYTDNEDVVMGVIEGELYGHGRWKYTSVALENPNISKVFLNEALYDYPEEFDITTRRWLVFNRSLTHEDLVSIIENEEEDMIMRSNAFRNPNIDKNYVSDIIDNKPHLLEKLPYSMIVHSHNKNEKTEAIKDEALFFGDYSEMAAAEIMTARFVPWELRFKEEIEEERKSQESQES